MSKGQNSPYLRLHRIPTTPSNYVLLLQVLCQFVAFIAVLISTLTWWIKFSILLILIIYFVFLLNGFNKDLELSEGRYLMLNDKDEWLLSEQNVVPQKLTIQKHVLITSFMLLLPFRAEKRCYTFIYCQDNLDAELGRILRVRLLNPVVSKHPLKDKS